MLEKILERNPNTKCYWIDYSDDFLKVAQRRLAKYTGRVSFILSSLEENWEPQIEGKVDAIISMSAIHHLTDPEKQRLYCCCFKILKNGGWFVNIDEMKTLYDDAYLNSLYVRIRHFEQAKASIDAEQGQYYEQWKEKLKNWKRRNIDGINKPKSKGDDIHAGFIEQLKWLKEAGFVNVDLFVKYHLLSLIGGQKVIEYENV